VWFKNNGKASFSFHLALPYTMWHIGNTFPRN